MNLDFQNYIQKSKEYFFSISNKFNFLTLSLNYLHKKRIYQPYLYLKSNIYNHSNINNINTKSKIPNEKKNYSSSTILKKEKIIRTVKNKKIVYCQGNFNTQYPSNLLNEFKTSTIYLNEEKEEKVFNINRGQRGSKYRGVSKNGNQWQVLIMINKKKRYIGNYKNEEEAASSYDIVAIQNHGNKAKTNFYYTPEQIIKIKNMKNSINHWN